MFSVRRLVAILTGAQIAALLFGSFVLHQIEHSSPSTLADPNGTGTLFLVRMVASFWMGGVFFAVNWLVSTKILKPVDNELQQKQEKTLMAMNELVRTRDAIVFGLAKLAESRDPETGQHLERISLYSVRLATAMRKDPRFREQINSEFIRMIGISSVLHDIGKVGIPDSLLLKEGPLTQEERLRIQIHPMIGGECIHHIERRLGNSDFLGMAREIAMFHHEWWDGSGYPTNISGTQIPLAARIVALADVYDALASSRIYKTAYSHTRCVEEICKNAGTHFDPDIVEVFTTVAGQFAEIASRFKDVADKDKLSFAEAEFVDRLVETGSGEARRPVEKSFQSNAKSSESHDMRATR